MTFEQRLQFFHDHHHRPNQPHYQALAEGQDPKILFITCSDSRVESEKLLGGRPGEVFTIENAGNIVPESTREDGANATIEFALTTLNIEHIVVCGHSHCGAMEGLLNPQATENMPTVRQWLEHAPEREALIAENGDDNEDLLKKTIEKNALLQVDHIKSHPAYIEATKHRDIQIHAWVYDFEQGQVFGFDETSQSFEPLIDTNSNPYPTTANLLLNAFGTIALGTALAVGILAMYQASPALLCLSMIAATAGGLSFIADSFINQNELHLSTTAPA